MLNVQKVRLNEWLSRYIVTLADHSDPVTFIGKEASLTESYFYRDLSHKLEFLAPFCWFNERYKDGAWLLLDDIPNYRVAHPWTEADLERAVNCLALLHATFWNRPAKLKQYRWLHWYLDPARTGEWLAMEQGIKGVSQQAWESAGTLTPTFLQINQMLQTLETHNQQTILQPEHRQAIMDLLDDPMPMLYPLRTLPPTLLHGNPTIDHWHLTLFGDGNLISWKKVVIGPGVCDLVTFMESVEQAQTLWHGGQKPETWVLHQETMVDSYLLRLHRQLWPLFDARTSRKTLPAASCLYVLTQGIPHFVQWLEQGSSPVTTIPPHLRIENELLDLPKIELLQSYWVDLFARFWNNYKML